MTPSSRCAASSNPRVLYRVPYLAAERKNTTTLPSAFAQAG